MNSDQFDSAAYGPLDHADLQALVEGLNASIGAAELHGMLTAELCTAGTTPNLAAILQQCLQFAGEDLQLAVADRNELTAVMVQTLARLEDSELSFSMLLPDDEAAISDRAAALAQWCQGFMFGFAVAEKQQSKAWSQDEDIAEILQDFDAISKVDALATEEEAASEQDLMQLAEYVRVAAMNIHAHCMAIDAQPKDDGRPLTLH